MAHSVVWPSFPTFQDKCTSPDRTRSKTLKPNFNSTSGLTKIDAKRAQFNSSEKLIRLNCYLESESIFPLN